MELVLFLFKVFGISLSGALAPGPVTAAAIGMGSRNRFAGTLMALGHGAIDRGQQGFAHRNGNAAGVRLVADFRRCGEHPSHQVAQP